MFCVNTTLKTNKQSAKLRRGLLVAPVVPHLAIYPKNSNEHVEEYFEDYSQLINYGTDLSIYKWISKMCKVYICIYNL